MSKRTRAMSDPLRRAVWETFFDGGTVVCMLPSAKKPRLFFADRGGGSRFHAAGFYPAFSRKARWFRKAAQVLAFAGVIPRQTVNGDASELRRFMSEAGFDDCDLVVMIGTPGSTQKAIALVKRGSRVFACLKYGVSADAKERIRQEATVLRQLNPDVAPACLASGPLGDGEAVLMDYVAGKPYPVRDPVPFNFLRLLQREESYPFLEHPWVQTMQATDSFRPESYPGLMQRQWPVVILHGDFAPWNIIQRTEVRGQKPKDCSQPITDNGLADDPSRDLCAVDWESALIEGFPFIDAAHYVIQSAQNLYHWSPAKTADEVIRSLIEMDETLSCSEARALARLSIDWLVFRDGLDLSSAGGREGWYRNVIEQLSGGKDRE